MASWKKILTASDIGTDTSLGNSNTVIPSQLAVKTYVDAQVDTADTIAELADTTISSVGTGELLRYNGLSSKWENKTLAEAGIQSTLGAGSVTTTMLADDSVTIAKMANMATDSFIGRDSAGTGNPEILDASTVRTILNVEDGATADQTNQEIVDALDNIATYALGSGLGGTITVNNDLVVSGDLTVSGDTTTINTQSILLEDNLIVLNSNQTGTPSADAGIEVERGDRTNVKFYYDEANKRWEAEADLNGAASGSSSVQTFGVPMVSTGTAASSSGPLAQTGNIHVNTDTDTLYVYI
jgi:hypothetical protein